MPTMTVELTLELLESKARANTNHARERLSLRKSLRMSFRTESKDHARAGRLSLRMSLRMSLPASTCRARVPIGLESVRTGSHLA